MRFGASLLLLLLQLANGSENYIGEMFGTNDFALLTQLKCARYVDTAIAADTCPGGLSNAENLDVIENDCTGFIDYSSVRMHLVRDVHRVHPPRILYVYVNFQGDQVNFALDSLSLTDGVSQWAVPAGLKTNSQSSHAKLSYQILVDSVFDTQSHLLYLIVESKSSSKQRHVQVYHVTKIYEQSNANFEHVKTFTVGTKFASCANFMENAYEHVVYYLRKDVGNTVTVHRMPTSELLTALTTGKEGQALRELPNAKRELIFAYNESMINLIRSTDDQVAADDYYLRKSFLTVSPGKRCSLHGTNPNEHKKRRVLAVMEWDYCMLRYGGDGTKNAAGDKCPTYYKDLMAVDASPSTSNTIYIVLVVLLSMVSFVLLVYVCWLRRNLDDSMPRDERKPVPYYPSGQPLDSTFDMSVDRWDQY